MRLDIRSGSQVKFVKQGNLNEARSVKVNVLSNKIDVEGDELALDDFQEYSVLSPDFSSTLNGNEYEPTMGASSPLWKAKVNDSEILLGLDRAGNLEFMNVDTHDNHTKYIVYSKNTENWLDSTESDIAQNLTSFVNYGAIDSKTINNETDAGIKKRKRRRRRRKNRKNRNPKRSLSNKCSSFRQIDVAIVYDSSFCALVGSAEAAFNRIQNIIGIASLKYEQPGMCVSLRLSALEGQCDSATDPYKGMSSVSGCEGQGLLYEFKDYWELNRSPITRDTAHLFTARKMTDGLIGCAFIGTICNPYFAYGINAMQFNSDITHQSILFAHELGHNCGANHYHQSKGYVMNPHIALATNGFSQDSMDSMSDYLAPQQCLKTIYN